MSIGTPRQSRHFLHEIDLVRVVTALSVIGVHVVAFTVVFNKTQLGADQQNGVVSALHYTREVFLTLTAFVMVHNYTKRPLKLRSFWRKRGLGVVVPYIVWSLFYVWFAVPHHPLGPWVHTALADILTGNASYQLYYILLTIEFYLALPLLLWFVTRYGHRPWHLLAVSFVLQMAMMYFSFNYLEAGRFATTPWGRWLNAYEWRMLPAYQFSVMLGAIAALYLDRLRDFAAHHSRLIVLGLCGGLGLLWLRYAQAIWIDHESDAYATQVFQPVMVIYSTSATLFLYWLGTLWAAHRSARGVPHGHRVVKWLSDGSFGIYLIHAFILNDVLLHLAPRLPENFPAALRVAAVWFIVAALTSAICVLMLYTPGLSRLIGRPCVLPPDFGPWRWARTQARAAQALGRLHRSRQRATKAAGQTAAMTREEIVPIDD